MAAVEVMSAACEPAMHIVESLQALNVVSPGDVPKVLENQDGSSSDGEHGQVLDANALAYCTSNGYGTTSVYYCGGYNPPSGGWVEEHSRGFGYDAGRFFPVYGEDGSILYYTSGYGYFPHCHQPPFCQQPPPTFISGPCGGHVYGHQAYPFPGPIYQHPVSQGVQYYSSSPFNNKQECPKPGYRKTGTVGGSNAPISKQGYQGLISSPLNGPYAWGYPVMAASYLNVRDGQAFCERAGMGLCNFNNPSVLTREFVPDAAAGVQKTVSQPMPNSSKCFQPTGQVPHACISASIPEPQPKAPQAYLRVGSNNSGRRGNSGFGVRSEKIKTTGCNLPGAEREKQQGQINAQQEQVKVHGTHVGESVDGLNEQTQGFRVAKCSVQQTLAQNCPNGQGGFVVTNNAWFIDRKKYNKEGFQTRYSDANFFIIKSYSEDDVHKSIKYNVWSSTPNGNRRLDRAFREAQDTGQSCPVFLFFSVNTSGQFCGVAEMIGSVDYNKSMDFWLQGKWSGCFPVKWHIVKDVPNSQFRHINLANNENKPVTHSRDTQEVKLEQGSEMLTIFKSFPLKTSILDDFSFYDDRQKFMEERKSKQRPQCQVVKAMDESSDDKSCGSLDEVARNEDKENGKPGEMQEADTNANIDINSKVSIEKNDDILPTTTDKGNNLKSDSGKDDCAARSINYKRALMENVKGMATVVGKTITV